MDASASFYSALTMGHLLVNAQGGGAHNIDHSDGDACGHVELEDYDWPLHIAAIFIVLVVSLCGAILPIAAKAFRRLSVNEYGFMLAKTFGMGIILSTGYIHMFPPADQNLTSPCLPPTWNEEYPAFAGLFALLATLTTQLIQTTAINHFKQRGPKSQIAPTPKDASGTMADMSIVVAGEPADPHHPHSPTGLTDGPIAQNTTRTLSPQTLELGAMAVAANIHSDGCCDIQAMVWQDHQHRTITTIILEVGVALHSLIIGITLGVTRGHEFVPLLVAICFHQFFEGFALSVTALEAGFQKATMPLMLALVYTLTTPVGVAIGVGISESYNGNAVETLLLIGIFDAISAGILIYDALVNLITTNITHSQWFSAQSLARKAGVFFALWTGAGTMSILGRWA